MLENTSKIEDNKTIKIPDLAYFNNQDIQEIKIPEGITEIGKRAFSKCSNLKSITLPNTLTSIEESAFSDCVNLEEIVLPPNIKKINYRAFAGCRRLKKITLPESLTTIGWATFSGCENLEEITLPNSLTTLPKQLFLNCKRLKRVTLPNNCTFLPDEFFKGCKRLDILLPKEITTLGNEVFSNCYKLFYFPSNVTQFGSNCFKNCRSLTEANINPYVTFLPDGMFDSCTNLHTILYQNDFLPIGKKCFKNCQSLEQIPSFITQYNNNAFENCTALTTIDITSSQIPFACFRGCTNIKVINKQEEIQALGNFAFSGCKSIETLNLPLLSSIPAEAFSNCQNLRQVKLSNFLQYIGSRAFYNCPVLTNINWSDTIERIGKQAFKYCHSIPAITIPGNLKAFGKEAFSYMDSLENIYVSPYNQAFITEDHKVLLDYQVRTLVLYASGSKDETYSSRDYVEEKDEYTSIIKPIPYIAECAFAGAKNLKELELCACTQDIEYNAFEGCTNLKKLIVTSIDFCTCPGFHIREHGRYYFRGSSKANAYLPFETVEFKEDLVQIFPGALENFNQVKTIIFPTDKPFSISEKAFSDCKLLKEVYIPANITTIPENAFPENTIFNFSNGEQIKKLISLKSEKYGKKYKLYTLEGENFIIEHNEEKTTTPTNKKLIFLTKQQIDRYCSHPEEIRDNPVLFQDFLESLEEHDLVIKELLDGILFANMSLENRQLLLDNLNKEDKFFLSIIKNSRLLERKDKNTEILLSNDFFQRFIDYVNLFKKYNITNPILHDKILIANYPIEEFEYLVKNDFYSLTQVVTSMLKSTKTSKEEKPTTQEEYNEWVLFDDALKNLRLFIELIKKYNIKDKYLYNPIFIAAANNTLFEKLLSIYDANTKRLIIASEITNIMSTAKQNFNDLLILMEITGALENNPLIRQKASTFIVEKIFAENLSKDKTNEYRIINDNIHRIFSFRQVREDFDSEFANFFLENYQNLIAIEKTQSGFIERTYNNFREISRTCTSNKGSQRKLKVTIDKCKNYLLNVKFDHVTKEYQALAELIGAWYDQNEVWLLALRVYQESLKAPRNIFVPTSIDEKGNILYDNNPKLDLKEPINEDFSYEWLPKQAYENLILGKLCSCCAHVQGAGSGIMRASMILDNVQNLVIRNEFGEIISKATLYINKSASYAVFNTVETSLNHRSEKELAKIYKAFLRGAQAFFKTYNENNPTNPLTEISIGANRNTILEFLNNQNHPEIKIKQSLNYGTYALNYGRYNGDWNVKQRLVLKK